MIKSDAISVSDGQQIALVDDDFEGHQAVNDFLDLIHGTSASGMLTGFSRVDKLIRLLRKHDCLGALAMVKACLRSAAYALNRSGSTSMGPIYLFELGAAMHDAETCRESIARGQGRTWSARHPSHRNADTATLRQNIESGLCWDVSAMRLEAIEYIGPRYLCALARAGRKINRLDWTNTDWKAVSEEFYRVVTS